MTTAVDISPAIKAKAAAIKLVVFDVDGVLTDGKIYLDANGQETKAFYAQDGQGMRLLLDNGFDIAIITSRNAPCVEHRLKALGVKHIFQGIHDKAPVFKQLLSDLKLSTDEVAYLGDDLPDIPLIKQVALGACPANASHTVKEYVDLVMQYDGGAGAVRELCELLLSAQDKLTSALAPYVG